MLESILRKRYAFSLGPLSDRAGVPKWLDGKGIDPWACGNEWVMKMALAWGASKVMLVAFWDGDVRSTAAGGTARSFDWRATRAPCPRI